MVHAICHDTCHLLPHNSPLCLDRSDSRNFEAVIAKARTASFNSGQRGEDHFVDITEIVEIGSGAQRPLKTVMMSR